jgi:hypothetical protein
MRFPRSKLQQSITADQEFDQILNMSEEALNSAKEPIPANRIALLRKIEEENDELRNRQRFRDLGYRTVVVLGIMVSFALMAILLWMCHLALRHERNHGHTLYWKNHAAHNNHLRHLDTTMTEHDPKIKDNIIHVSRKMAISNKKISREPLILT